MFKFIFLLTFIVFGTVFAHKGTNPTSLDHRGMHNCWINCEQKGLYHGEYHGGHDSEEADTK